MANAYDDLLVQQPAAPAAAAAPAVAQNAYADLAPAPFFDPKNPNGKTPGTDAEMIEEVKGAVRALPKQFAHAATDVVTAIPNMAGDFVAGVGNLGSKLTGGDEHRFPYPSDQTHQAEDQLYGPLQGKEKVGAALSSMIMGGAASAEDAPAALRTLVNPTPTINGAGGQPVPTDFVSPKQAQAQQLATALQKFQGAGYVVPPSTTNPTIKNQLIETLGSKVGTAQRAAASNSDAVTQGVKADLGLSTDAPLTLEAIQAVKRESGGGWNAVRDMGSVQKDQAFTDNLRQMRAKLQASGDIGAEPSPLIKEIDRMLGDKTIANSGVTPTIPGNPLATAQGTRLSAVAPGASNNVALDPVTLQPVKAALTNSLMNAPAAAAAPVGGGVAAGGNSILDPLTMALRKPVNNSALFPGSSATGSARTVGSSGASANIDPLTLTSRPSTFSADQALNRITELRDAKDAAFRNGNGGLGRGYGQLSGELEDLVARNAAARAAAGDKTVTPDVVQRLQDSRRLYAKASTAENAFDEGTGKISLEKLGRMYANDEPLSGNMQIGGQFASSFRKAAQDPSKIGSAGVNHLEGGLTGLAVLEGGRMGHEYGGIPGAIAGVAAGASLPFIRRGAMNYALGPGQVGAIPKLATATPGDLTSTAARTAALVQALQASKQRNNLSLDPAPAQ